MNKFVGLTVLAAFAVIGVISETPVYQCNNNVPLPLSAQINDCELLPCLLPIGSTVLVDTVFNAVSSIEQLKPEVIAHALGVSVNLPLTETDGCKNLLNSRCPIEEGETAAYQFQMPILSIYPQISVDFEFTLYGDGEPIACFIVNTTLIAPN